MPSQFFGLNIAYTGLLANNAALNTTSNNIANVQTEGYSRQQVNQQAASALQIFQAAPAVRRCRQLIILNIYYTPFCRLLATKILHTRFMLKSLRADGRMCLS